MTLFEKLLDKSFVLIVRHLKLLSLTCNYARMFLVQILLDVFESFITINQFVRFYQPILTFLIVLQLLRVIVTVFLLLPESVFLFQRNIGLHVVFCAVETCLWFYDCYVLRLKLFCLKLFLCFWHLRGRLQNLRGFLHSCIFLDQIFQLDIRLILNVEVLIYYLLGNV